MAVIGRAVVGDLLVVCSMFVGAAGGTVFAAPPTTAVHDAVVIFVDTGRVSAWEEAVLAARTGPRDSVESAYSIVVDYYVGAMKRDLPNSMALSNLTPGEHTAQLCEKLGQLIIELRSQDSARVNQLLEAMVRSEDSTLVGVAAEIARRLSRERYERLGTYLAIANPSNTSLFLERGSQVERDPSIVDCFRTK